MIKIYKIVCDIMRCFVISCAVTLLIFFFDAHVVFTKESARMAVGAIFTILLVSFAMYVIIFERTRYKDTGVTVVTEPIGRGVLNNEKVADYNRRVSCVHEAGHAVMSYLKGMQQFDAVVTDTHPHVVSVFKAMDAEDVRKYVVMLYAGAAAEELFFGSFHSGAACCEDSDFSRAISFMKMYLTMIHSDISKACLDEEVSGYIKELSNELYNESFELLSENRQMVEVIAKKLKENGSLTTKEIEALLKNI